MERKAVRMFVVLKILQSACLGFIATTYVPFLLDNGLDLFQANQVNIAFMFVNVLLDPLTGSLADKIGQKKVYILGFVFVGLGCFVYGMGLGFWAFVVAESISAIGTALWSEALESWIRNLYGKELSHEANAKGGYFSKTSSVVFGFSGAFAAASFGLRIPWFMGCAVALIAIVVGAVFTRRFPDPTNGHAEEKGSIKDAIKLFVNIPELRLVALVTCVSTVAYQALNMFWTPIFQELSGSLSILGYIWAGVSIFTSVGYYSVRKLKKPNIHLIGTLLLLTGLPIFISATFFEKSFWVLLAGFLLHEVGRSGVPTLLFTYSNDYIPNEVRSTSNSVRGSAGYIGAIVGLYISGLLTKYMTRVDVWVISGAVLIILSILVLLSKKSDR